MYRGLTRVRCGLCGALSGALSSAPWAGLSTSVTVEFAVPVENTSQGTYKQQPVDPPSGEPVDGWYEMKRQYDCETGLGRVCWTSFN